ncbi:DciA family protein [Streptomyces scopuliridis]|uniref:DciA family protein n=1 Tax=Streptomyces scopuliridis TaxID=452529 RepID=UPI003691943A
MTETTTPIEQPADDGLELSGVDLARVALHQAREAAKKRGDSEARAPRRRRQRVVQRDGREPTGFAAVLQGLMADRAWDIPAAGGSVLDQWPDIAAAISPTLREHVAAVAFHAENGQLDLRPDSPAYATQLRLIGARIVAAANDAVGTAAVQTVRVLAVGATAAPQPRTVDTVPATGAAVPEMPVKTRDMASGGFHQALAAHQSARTDRCVDPGITAAVERQNRAMRELSAQAFPEPETAPDDAPASIEPTRAQRRREAAATHAAALRRAQAERAGRQTACPRPLGRTA